MNIKVTKFLIDVVPETERWLTDQDVSEWVESISTVVPQGSYAENVTDDQKNITQVQFVVPKSKRFLSSDVRDAVARIHAYADVTIRSHEEVVDRHDYEMPLRRPLDEDQLEIVPD